MRDRTIKVASRLPLAVVLSEPAANPDKPGEAPPARAVTLAGGGHPGEESVTEVDAAAFAAWKSAYGDGPWIAEGWIREVPDDYVPEPRSFGHEPGLAALAGDAENTKLAERGAGGEEGPPVPATALAATSATPNDDSPRSQVGRNAPPQVPPGSVVVEPAKKR